MDAPAAPRPLDLGEIIVASLRVYRDNFLTLIIIVAIFQVPLIAIAVANRMLPNLDFLLGMLRMLVVLLGSLLSSAAATYAAGQGYIEGQADVGAAYREALDAFGEFFSRALMVGIVLMLLILTVVGIPFAIYFGVRWSISGCAIMLEGQRARPSLSRSSDLVKGSWWRVFGISIVLVLIPLAVEWSVYAAPLISGQVRTLSAAIASVNPAVTALLAIFVGAFTIVGQTVLYYDLRAREEELEDGLEGGLTDATPLPATPW